MTAGPGPDLAAIRARADAATPGPWIANLWEIYAELVGGRWVAETCDPSNSGQAVHNAEFVANARTDVPALLGLVERLTEQLAVSDAEVKRLRTNLETMTYNATSWMEEAQRQAAERDKKSAEVERLRDELDQARAERDDALAILTELKAAPAAPSGGDDA